MCGRYNLITDAEALLEFFEIQKSIRLDDWPRYNIAPSRRVPVVARTVEGRSLEMAKWGLVPHWAKESQTRFSTINARAETVATSAAYRTAFRQSRCIVPATGYFEWKKTPQGKQPFNITSSNGTLLAMAGIRDIWHVGQDDQLVTFSIITTTANQRTRDIHERMPVMLRRADHDVWMDQTTPFEQLHELMRPCPDDWLRAYRVSTVVNSPEHDGPDCVLQL